MTTFRHALIFVPAALLLTGAKPADSLRATFADPGAEYRPVPFWHLNGRLSSDEIVRQLEDAKNLAGFGGVTVLPVSPGAQHPTGKPCPGMEPAYLSREYFDRYEEMLRISERLGQKLIVYDDIDFPSGTAGGRLLREYPRYTRKLLEMQEFEVCGPARFEHPLAVSDTLRCMAVSAMETASRRIVDLGAAVRRDTLAWDVPDGVWKIMFFNCRYAVHPLVDYMEPEAVECCISMTYDQYAKRFGRYFGGVVDKVFFDDVGYVSMERTWTPAITGLFESRYGRPAALYYPALFYDIGPETAAARVAFYGLRAELMAEGYPRQVAQWCASHGLSSIGHPPGNYCTNPTDMHGDILKFYRHTQIPLTDYIFYYGHGRDGFKQVGSAADLYDRPLVGAELCGAFDAAMDSLMLYRVTLDLFACGVNYLVPHGMWYDPAPEHVRIPPLISPYNPTLAPALKRYSDFAARSCAMLQGGRRVADVAVLYPIAAAQAGFRFGGGDEWGESAPPELDYQRVGALLTTVLHRDYTLVHPEMLTDGRVRPEGRTMLLDNRVNRQRYDVLILPGGKVFSAEALGRVREFYERGGRVIATSCLPERSAEFGMDDALRSEVEALFGSPSERRAGTVRRNGAGGAAVFVPEPDGAGLCRFGGRSGCRDRRYGAACRLGDLVRLPDENGRLGAGGSRHRSDRRKRSLFLLYPQAERRAGYLLLYELVERFDLDAGFAARQAEAAAVGPVHGRDDRARLAQGAPQRRNLYAFRARSASRVGRFRRGRAPRIRSGIRPCGDSRAGVGTENRPAPDRMPTTRQTAVGTVGRVPELRADRSEFPIT